MLATSACTALYSPAQRFGSAAAGPYVLSHLNAAESEQQETPRVARNVVFASLAVAGGMMIACIADLTSGYPFGGQMMLDILFIVAALIVGWMGIDCLRGIRR